jgi:hypothetical protein
MNDIELARVLVLVCIVFLILICRKLNAMVEGKTTCPHCSKDITSTRFEAHKAKCVVSQEARKASRAAKKNETCLTVAGMHKYVRKLYYRPMEEDEEGEPQQCLLQVCQYCMSQTLCHCGTDKLDIEFAECEGQESNCVARGEPHQVQITVGAEHLYIHCPRCTTMYCTKATKRGRDGEVVDDEAKEGN